MPASQLPGRLADRFLADSPFATGYRLQATGFAPVNAALATTNAALATTNAGIDTGKTPFAPTNAALDITNDLPRIQSSSRSYPRMQHSTSRVTHSCSRRNCPVLNHVAKGLLLSSLSTPATAAESNGCKTVPPGGYVSAPSSQLLAPGSQLPAPSYRPGYSTYPSPTRMCR